MRRLFIVGASASGKSFMARQAAKLEINGACPVVPVRFTTREPRRDEVDSEENRFVSKDKFETLVKEGHIEISWKKVLPDRTCAWYGFEPAERGSLVIYSANSYLLIDPKASFPAGLRMDATIIELVADLETRLSRLLARNPRPDRRELVYRLLEPERALYIRPADIVIRNDRDLQEQSLELLLRIIHIPS